jgi:ribosome-associated protein
MADRDDGFDVGHGVVIPADELQFRYSPSGGPGGQHANKASTRVELTFEVATSGALSESQRRRVRDRLGDQVRVVADDERSQRRNRALALERLRERISAALVVPKRRRPTKPSKRAKERRLAAKKQQSERKQGRRRPELE